MGNSDERRSERTNVILNATIESAGARFPVRIGNLSAHGAMVIAGQVPPPEAPVVFRCNGVAVEGWVAWARDGRAGIQFGEALDPGVLTKRAPVPQTAIVKDRRKLDCRRPGFRGNQMTAEERRIVEDWNRPPPERSSDNQES